MVGDQALYIQALYLTIDDTPLAAHHYPVGAVGTAEQQGGKGVVAAGEAQFIELEERQIRLLADGQFADVVATEQLGRATSNPARPHTLPSPGRAPA